MLKTATVLLRNELGWPYSAWTVLVTPPLRGVERGNKEVSTEGENYARTTQFMPRQVALGVVHLCIL